MKKLPSTSDPIFLSTIPFTTTSQHSRLHFLANSLLKIRPISDHNRLSMQNVDKAKALIRQGLFSIQPVTPRIDRDILSLAYTPGVGMTCMEIQKHPYKADRYTIRQRSVAILSDGGLLNCDPKPFMAAMDWFVFQLKHYSGVDAYPFVVMKNADLTGIIKNLMNTYCGVVYLDGRLDFQVPPKCLFIRHQNVRQFQKGQFTDARATARVLSYHMAKEIRRQLSEKDYQEALSSPNTFCQKFEPKEFQVGEGTLEEKARRFHHHYQGKITIQNAGLEMSHLREIFTDESVRLLMKDTTVSSRTSKIAVIVTDGTAILGLGDIGPVAGLPVMEGKSLLFKLLGDVDVIPFCISPASEQSEVELISQAVGNYMAINLEDIKAPQCFGVEKGLQKLQLLPIFHDDQHGTAIVTLAALINALKLSEKDIAKIRIVVNGAGAAGITIAKLILAYGATNIVVCDSKGAIVEGREGLNQSKRELARMTNPDKISGSLERAIVGMDVFIGVSSGGAFKAEWVKRMATRPIIFAMANPIPEIYPEEAQQNGVFIYGSGRSDFKNQINNSLVFPGIFRGIQEHGIREITMDLKLAVARALAESVGDQLAIENILPSSLNTKIGKMISNQMGGLLSKL